MGNENRILFIEKTLREMKDVFNQTLRDMKVIQRENVEKQHIIDTQFSTIETATKEVHAHLETIENLKERIESVYKEHELLISDIYTKHEKQIEEIIKDKVDHLIYFAGNLPWYSRRIILMGYSPEEYGLLIEAVRIGKRMLNKNLEKSEIEKLEKDLAHMKESLYAIEHALSTSKFTVTVDDSKKDPF